MKMVVYYGYVFGVGFELHISHRQYDTGIVVFKDL
jgi:hypothetical protein